VKSLGNGTMSSCTSTNAALTAAREIRRREMSDLEPPSLQPRIGIHTGEVIENRDDFCGTVVNKAYRINAVAEPDEVLLSDATKSILDRHNDFQIGDPKEVVLKGIEGTHCVYRLTCQTTGDQP
jgi:class 3 adenylate cyclase